MSSRRLTVDEEQDGARLDVFLAETVGELSRSQAQRLIGEGTVRIGGTTVGKPSRPVVAGETIEFELRQRPPASELVPEAIPLRILYEDDALAAIDKPADLVVHPAPGNRTGTLVHALLHRFGDRLSSFADAGRPGIVHRLDKGTTGVIVVALTDAAHQSLARQFAERTVAKTYLAVVYGCPKEGSGLIDVPIGRDRQDRKKISHRTGAPRAAQTEWEVIEQFDGLCLVRLRPRTGRTHQIRAHLAWLNHPLVGDELYAGRQWKGLRDPLVRSAAAAFARPALHAAALEIDHPVSGERMRMEAPMPEDLEALLELLRSRRDRPSGAP